MEKQNNLTLYQSKWIEYLLQFNWNLFCTLTYPPEVYSPNKVKEDVNLICRKLGKLKQGVYFLYFYIVKNFHVHCLFLASKTIDPLDYLFINGNDEYNMNFDFPLKQRADIKPIDDLKDLISVCTYICKKRNMTFNELGELEFQEFHSSQPKRFKKLLEKEQHLINKSLTHKY